MEELVNRRFPDKIRAIRGRMLQNPVKSLHEGHQLGLILAFVACVVLQVGMVGFVNTLHTGLQKFGVILSLMVLDLLMWQYSRRPIYSGLETYLRTGALVLEDYALLIMLNRKYIEIAIIPFAMLAFIGALAIKYRKYGSEEVKGLTRLTMSFMAIAYVPCVLQLMLVISTQYKRQVESGNIFILSSFLLFLGSALSAQTMMVDSQPMRGSPSVNQVLPTMQKTCIVMLMMTSHSMAAEWLWEDMVFAFMPELTLLLSWCTIYCYRPKVSVRIINRSLTIVLSSVGAILLLFLAYMYVLDRIILRSWLVWLLCIFTSSSALSCLDVWLLHEWPAGSTPNFKGGLVELLKLLSLITSCVSAWIAAALILPLMLRYAWTMVVIPAGQLAVSIKKWAMDRSNIVVDWYWPPLAPWTWLSAPWTWLCEKHQWEKYFEQIRLAYTAINRPEVVAIFGLGPCKKTDIASQLYESTESKFDCHVSVKVGPNPDMAQLIRSMIKQVDIGYNIRCEAAGDVNQLTRTMWELLHGKRYLVVLDDLWSNNDWITIKSCFPYELTFSRIMITKGFEDAATGDCFCWISARVEADMESLFHQPVLQWKEFGQMKQLIEDRFNDLSKDLRGCLLCLSIFPAKHEVEINSTVKNWFALGLGGKDHPFTEEEADNYINEIVNVARNRIKESSYDRTEQSRNALFMH